MRFGYARTRGTDKLEDKSEAEAKRMLGSFFGGIVEQARAKGVGLIYAIELPGDYMRVEADPHERNQQYQT